MKVRKKAIGILMTLCISLSIISVPAQGASSEAAAAPLTLDAAAAKMLAYDHQLAILDQNIDSLYRQSNSLLTATNQVQQMLDNYTEFERLYTKEHSAAALTQQEAMNLARYRAIFGTYAPTPMNGQSKFDTIKDADFGQYALWVGAQNLKNTKNQTKNFLVMAVRQSYDGLLSMQESIAGLESNVGSMQKQYDQLLTKLKLGQVSEIERFQSEVRLEQQKLLLSKLKRDYSSQEMAFNKLIGQPLTTKNILTAAPITDQPTLPPDYNTYLEKALKSRSEVLNAQNDLTVKQRELGIMEQYSIEKSGFDYREEDQGVAEKRAALKEAVNTVTNDMQYAYTDLTIKKKNIDIAKSSLDNTQKQYDDAKLRYDQGLLPLSALWDLQTALITAKNSYNSAQRAYSTAWYKMDLSTGAGPGYNSAAIPVQG